MMIKQSLVKIKEHPPYVGDMEGKVLLNSTARATFDPKTGEYSFKGKLATEVPLDVANAKAFSAIAATNGFTDGTVVGVGVDQGLSNFFILLHRLLIIYVIQSWFLLYLHITLPSSATTSPKLRSHTVMLNHRHLRHSQLDGLARKPYSNLSAWNPRVLALPWRTLESSMMNLVFPTSACMVKPKPQQLIKASPKSWSLLVIPRLVVPIFKCWYGIVCLCRLLLLHLPKHHDEPVLFSVIYFLLSIAIDTPYHSHHCIYFIISHFTLSNAWPPNESSSIESAVKWCDCGTFT